MSRKPAARRQPPKRGNPSHGGSGRAGPVSSDGRRGELLAGQVQTGVQWVTVDEDMAGQRVDNFLLARLRGVPKSIVYRIVRKGEVRVNKGRVRPDSRLQAGDVVRIPPIVQKSKPESPTPGDRVQSVMEAAVVFENDDMLVVNKPSGIAVHGGSGLSFGLIEVLRSARPQAKFLELVHRLDRDTSGLVMVAKNARRCVFFRMNCGTSAFVSIITPWWRAPGQRPLVGLMSHSCAMRCRMASGG